MINSFNFGINLNEMEKALKLKGRGMKNVV
jgi:hypothetical protein